MLVNHHKEKLINAMIYFVNNTKYCGKIKLFKLLYFLDFDHFSETGRSVTGLDYYAWKMGPYPKALAEEIDHPTDEMKKSIAFSKISTKKGKMLKPNVLRPFNPNHFTKREYRLLQRLALEYQDAQAEDMIEATHLENKPWHQIYEVQKRRLALIPYEYALKRQEKAEMLVQIQEANEFWESYQ